MSFRERLLATLRAVRNVLDEPGIMVARAEMPDPVPHRARLAELMARLEKAEPA